jgi:hypothetical protein
VTCACACLLGGALFACGESRSGAGDAANPAEGGTAGSAGIGGSGQAGSGTTQQGGTGGSEHPVNDTACVNGCSSCGFADEDGDGWGNENLVCRDTYPGAVSGLGGDCDDTNPNLQQALWVDQDRNGAGRDGGLDCGLSFAAIDVADEPHCEGFDLRPVDSAPCNDCNLQRLARIANVGTQAVEGYIYVTTDDGGQVKMLEGLPAGAVSQPFEIPFFEQTFRVSTGEGSDCNPDNDVYAAPEPAGMRAFCIPK